MGGSFAIRGQIAIRRGRGRAIRYIQIHNCIYLASDRGSERPGKNTIETLSVCMCAGVRVKLIMTRNCELN